MARGPEGMLQDRVVKMFRARGWLAQKNSGGAGWADFTFISPHGFVLFAEFKVPGEGLRRIQQAWHLSMQQRIAEGRLHYPNKENSVAVVIFDTPAKAYDWLEVYRQKYAI
jgi:hypothetical protein